MQEVDYIIVGGGLPSLVLAQYIANDDPGASVLIIEKDCAVGGQYTSSHHEKYGFLDYGMHVYYDTCVTELDNILENALPVAEWHVYGGNDKDPCGLFWNGRLHLDMPYPDLRSWPEEHKSKFLFEMLNVPELHHSVDDPSLRGALVRHFGPSLVDEVLAPIYRRTYRLDISEMAEVAWKFQALNRVVLLEEEAFASLMDSAYVRSKIAATSQFSEQILKFKRNGQRALYPRRYGFAHVVDGLVRNLGRSAVEIRTSTVIASLELGGRSITSLTLDSGESLRARRHVFWTAGLMPLKALLEPKMAIAAKVDLEKKPQINYVHFILRRPPKVKEVYYIYSFEKGGSTFRVALYPNYCNGQFEQDGVAKICSEFWVYPDEHLGDEEVIERARRELLEMDILEDSADILDVVLRRQSFGGVPSPRMSLLAQISVLGEELKGKVGGNTSLGGAFSDNECFFVHEVIKDNVAKYHAAKR